MKTVYFVYSDVWAHDGWHLHGIFSEEEIAKQYMLKWAERDYKDYKQYCVNRQKEYGDRAVIEVSSFEAFLAKEYSVVAKQVVETPEDACQITCESYVVDLATGNMELTTFGLDFEFGKDLEREPHFLGSEKIAMDDDTLDAAWTCGNTKEDSLIKLKKWLKEQLKDYPVSAVKPCQALLE